MGNNVDFIFIDFHGNWYKNVDSIALINYFY